MMNSFEKSTELAETPVLETLLCAATGRLPGAFSQQTKEGKAYKI
jgi:hypothetical protein